jgi:hypothetical protein
VRMMLRPMRPKPLMPTLMGILPPNEMSATQSTDENQIELRTRNRMGRRRKSQREERGEGITNVGA